MHGRSIQQGSETTSLSRPCDGTVDRDLRLRSSGVCLVVREALEFPFPGVHIVVGEAEMVTDFME